MSIIHPQVKTLTSLSALCVALVLAGCNKEHASSDTQIVAKVNKEEISVHQVNAVLAKVPGITSEQAKVVGKQVLDKLIDQQLLVQQAMEKKLDREPATMQAIESARREILAKAYLEQLGNAVAKPSPEDVKAYYTQHPEMFSERRIFTFNQVISANKEGLPQALQEQIKTAKSLAEVADWLNAQKVSFSASSGTSAAEQMPQELLPSLHKMKDGQIGLIAARDRIIIMQLVNSRTEAVDEKTASPLIERRLWDTRKLEVATKAVKDLHDKASIEYQGMYADAGKVDANKVDATKTDATKAASAATAPANPAATPAAAATAAPAAQTAETGKTAEKADPAGGLFDKGLQGIR